MATLALEVNDAGLVALRAGSTGLRRREGGPGVALFEGSRLVVGQEARAMSRLLPRLTTSRFWDELDTTPLGRPFPDGVTAADLAHAHLEGFWKGAERGVRESSPSPGTGANARWGCSGDRPLDRDAHGRNGGRGSGRRQRRPGQRMLHLDLTLHRAVATEIGRVLEPMAQRWPAAGVEASRWACPFCETLAHRIAEAFVRQALRSPARRRHRAKLSTMRSTLSSFAFGTKGSDSGPRGRAADP
jgi:hypothetical protein